MFCMLLPGLANLRQDCVPRTLRVKLDQIYVLHVSSAKPGIEQLVVAVLRKQPGMRDCIPLEVSWDKWDTCGFGSLCRRDRPGGGEVGCPDKLKLRSFLQILGGYRRVRMTLRCL